MPGVHVRTLSQLNWLNQEKECGLTIPGSYWLCHKKNIYKFIFRYHRTVRNTTQFSYGRELLKIIRRIIKCHPTQGQQFGTQHLLVTYNCTSWTRQDKMFAILKFQQRTNAAAFSHAFVLTIRMCSSSEHLLDLKYPIVKEAEADTTFKDFNVSMDVKEKIIRTVICTTNKESKKKAKIYQNKKVNQISEYSAIEDTLNKDLKTTVNFNLQDNINNSANFHKNLNARIKSATIAAEVYLVNKHDTEFHEDKFMNCNVEGRKKIMKQYPIDHIEEQPLRSIKKIDEIEEAGNIDEKTESIQKQNQEIQTIQKYTVFSPMEPPFTEVIKGIDKWPLLNRSNFDENSIEKDNINNKDNLKDKRRNNETIVNPNNVPYQYFIEKEIEDAKHTTRFISNTFSAIDQPMREDLQAEAKDINKNFSLKVIKINSDESIYTKQEEHYNKIINLKSQENDKQYTRILLSTDNNQSQDNIHNKTYKACKQKSRESERKTVSNNKILRSSNITDLVMEGLMFTIRQDQDSIAVIEQKTELEVDEVLENSEKVETKAGEKCLLNSSLLRLENLVTMIDLPNKNKQNKTGYGISNKAYLPSFNTFPNSTICNLDINHIDRRMDKSSIVSCDRHNATDLNLCESQWQHQPISSSIKNSHSCSVSEHTTEESERLIENSNKHEQDRNDKNNIKMEKGKNIIPEAFQSITFPTKETNTKLQNKNLLIDDINMGETDKCNMFVKGYYSSLLPSLSNLSEMSKEISTIPEESGLAKVPRREANVPRIVSDKAITIDQMPIALQKVLQHACRTRKCFSTINDGTLQHERKIQHSSLVGDTISAMNVSLNNKCVNLNMVNNSLSIKSLIDSEEIKNNKNESCVMIDKNASKINEDTCARNIKRKNNEVHRISRRTSLSKHSSPRKLQDITEDFYYDLLHVHNKDIAIRQKCLRQRRKSLDNPNDIKDSKIRIEMLKFIQDITEGARVVVKRLSIDKPNLLKKNSTLESCTH